MTARWDDLFDRADAYDVTLADVRDALARRRADTPDDGGNDA